MEKRRKKMKVEIKMEREWKENGKDEKIEKNMRKKLEIERFRKRWKEFILRRERKRGKKNMDMKNGENEGEGLRKRIGLIYERSIEDGKKEKKEIGGKKGSDEIDREGGFKNIFKGKD